MATKRTFTCGAAALFLASAVLCAPAVAQDPRKPNIILLVSDDTGLGDLGPYGGGIGRGMPTPNIDRLSSEGMTFFSFYAQPSCTPAARPCRLAAFPTAAA